MKSKWHDLKTLLIRKKILSKYFSQDADQRAVLSKRRFAAFVADYEPLLFESHLRDVSSHLDRVLAYRRDMREMEILAVRSAADYALAQEQAKDQLALDLLRLRKSQAAREKEGHQKASLAFGAETNIAAGFREISAASAASLSQDVNDADSSAALMQQMYQRTKEYQDQYFQRHNTPGNSHNYAERSAILLELLLQDLGFAYVKSAILNSGFKMIFGREPLADLPSPFSPELIDDLVMWVRSVIEEATAESQQESEFNVIIPLVQKNKTGKSIVTTGDFDNAIANTANGTKPFRLSFKLTAAHFPEIRNLRVKSIGLSFGSDTLIEPSGIDRGGAWESYCKYNAKLITPLQKDGKTAYRRPPVMLSAISVFGDSPDISAGPECVNIVPVGDWEIIAEPRAVTKDIQNITLNQGVLELRWLDLKLHFRVRGSWPKGGKK